MPAVNLNTGPVSAVNIQTDKAPLGWNVYEPEETVCIDTRIGEIQTPGGRKPVLIVELVSLHSDKSLIKFFNCQRLKSGNYSVNRNSDFAKLYRTTLGDNPKHRFSKVQQLLKHFRGSKFICEYIDADSPTYGRYHKVTDIKPLHSILSDEWIRSGKQITSNFRKHKNAALPSDKPEDIKRTQIGYSLDKDRQNIGYLLDMPIGDKASKTNASSHKPIPLPHSTLQDNKVEPSSHTPGYIIKKVSGKERVIQFEMFKSESKEEYIERAISQSLEL